MVIGKAASSAGGELERVDPEAAQRAQASLGKLFAYVMELYTAGASRSVSAAEADASCGRSCTSLAWTPPPA